jgi:hypothetical protein
MAMRKTKTRSRRAVTRYTTSRRVAARGGNPWSREEIAFLRKNYRKFETAWVARQLGRTVYSVRYKASDLNIRKAKPTVWRGCTGGNIKPAFSSSMRHRKPAKRRTASKTRWAKPAKRHTIRKARSTRRITRKASSRRTYKRTR